MNSKWLAFIPPVLFLALGLAFYVSLSREEPNALPSMLAGKPAPQLVVTPLEGYRTPTQEDIDAPGVKLVNFWASWCPPCRAEHPTLMKLADEGYEIIGINQNDEVPNAVGFLKNLGDPFISVGRDAKGRHSLDWGVYGLPETFVVDGNGDIVLRYAGPITSRILDQKIRPALEAAKAR